MGLLKKFCYCCNVRRGSIFSGFYSTVYSLIYVSLLFFRYIGFSYLTSSKTYSVLVYTSVVIFGLHSISSLIVVLGICTDSVIFLFPFIFTAVVCMCHAAITICLVFVKEFQDNGEIGAWEACISVYHMINIIVTFYCLLCVFSQTQDFMRGKGTARYYRRRRSRRRRRAAMILDAMELGQQPPPLPFLGELYNDLTPYPVPGPVIEPPSYVEKPPPYSTLPRPETTSQSASEGHPYEPDAGHAVPEVGATGGAAATGNDGACADAVDITRSCCELGACSCQSRSVLTPVDMVEEMLRTNHITEQHLRRGECNIRSRDNDECDVYASSTNGRCDSLDDDVALPEGVLRISQAAFVITQRPPISEWDHNEGLVATCDSITHI